MKLQLLTPAKSLNKAYLKQSLKREQIELFKANLSRLFDRINEKESESVFPARLAANTAENQP
jgi:adenine-specific DNA-methyltransferase